ncbi:YodC family protein [Burkholderia glumae]|uniref:YodC family protein n=1 Tax=Burkholderia glumae TaxID=337 RepID=UPI000406D53A|nr:DUF2158 domain-containing protein [Burkholderia glumae]QKM52184.1 hypothetical protein CG017_00173 [Burkholderia glumae]
MATGKLKISDIVKLKSGGPDMTIHEIVDSDYECQWFAGKKLESGWFKSEALQRVEPTEE